MTKTITLDNGMEVIQNFDWDITNRKLCIFMPNYHDQKFTKCSLNNIKTTTPKDDYVVIVGNDGDHVPFDEFEDDNVYYFTLNRKDKSVRNGCFIRNYVIKRCQSELFFQKDGEVVMLGDFIKSCIDSGQGWRAGKIYVLNDDQTNHFIANGTTDSFIKNPTKIIDNHFPDTVDEVKDIIIKAAGGVNLSTYHHYAYCMKTDVLKQLRGYDEDYYYYGFEDSDMFCRLYSLDYKLKPDYSISAVHLCHPKPKLKSDINIMGDLFKNKDPRDSVRNPNGWGEGQ